MTDQELKRAEKEFSGPFLSVPATATIEEADAAFRKYLYCLMLSHDRSQTYYNDGFYGLAVAFFLERAERFLAIAEQTQPGYLEDLKKTLCVPSQFSKADRLSLLLEIRERVSTEASIGLQRHYSGVDQRCDFTSLWTSGLETKVKVWRHHHAWLDAIEYRTPGQNKHHADLARKLVPAEAELLTRKDRTYHQQNLFDFA